MVITGTGVIGVIDINNRSINCLGGLSPSSELELSGSPPNLPVFSTTFCPTAQTAAAVCCGV